MSRPRAVAVVGPTASGKSALAHAAARVDRRREVLCVDAMTVYRGMDIGTAKPTVAERREVRYHLLDLADPAETFNVGLFQGAARAAEAEIEARGGVAIYVGGTGLYGRAVLDDLEIPGQFPEIRAALERDDPSTLYAELQSRDPLAASRIEPGNTRRLVRALEVIRGTGRAFSSFGPGLEYYGAPRVVQVGLRVELPELDRRIAERFAQWMRDGLLDEVRALAGRPAGLSVTARQAVGYRELLEHVEGGRDLGECVTAAISQSRRLARRQRRWFERDPRIEWYEDPAEARARVEEVLGGSGGGVRDWSR